MRNKLIAILLIMLVPVAAWAVSNSFTITVATTFTPLHTYFMAASGCSDANAGTSAGSPWCQPDNNGHVGLVCGDVVIAATGAYTTSGFAVTHTPTSCPSASAGIDGSGGIYAVPVICQTAFACTMNYGGGSGTGGVSIQASHWAIEGWQVTTTGGNAFCFFFDSSGGLFHHVAFINDICNNAGSAFVAGGAVGTAVPGQGPDYFATVGSLAWKANQRADFPTAAFVDVVPANCSATACDASTGTRIYWDGNFAINNAVPNSQGAPFDVEGMMLDTPDGHAYTGKTVFRNNIIYGSSGVGIQITGKNGNSSSLEIDILQNTLFDNETCTPYAVFALGEINPQLDGTWPYTINTYNNIAQTNATQAGCSGAGGWIYAMLTGGAGISSATVTTGGTGIENIFKGLATVCLGTGVNNGCNGSGPIYDIAARDGTVIGTNTYVSPSFTNTSDLLTNWLTSQPNCTSYENVAACMGWNFTSQTATTLTVIDDLNSSFRSSGKGYQPPKNTCAPDALFPTWLKGLIYLKWTGSIVQQVAGLANSPCGM